MRTGAGRADAYRSSAARTSPGSEPPASGGSSAAATPAVPGNLAVRRRPHVVVTAPTVAFAPMSTVESIAEWAAGLRVAEVPGPVLELCRAQRRSVLGACAASTVGTGGAARRVLGAVESWAADGPAPLLGTDRSVRPEDAAYGAAALSVALDFDDYVCFGHTGHSAVLVPVLLAAETGSDGDEQMAAQVVANEVEARLGGACLLGPMNGQLWAFIHGAGAALAAGRLLGLDARRLAHALAIALAHPVRATVPGFMAPDSKLLVAAEPTTAGIRAARLAAEGVTGPLDILDDRRGALDALSYAPIRGMLSGLGEGWATLTLCVKRYPGCAYLDTLLDALDDHGAIDAVEVDEVVVEAGVLTCGMDALSRPYAALEPPTPVTVTFSVPWNVAVWLKAGRLTPEETDEAWLAEHRDELATLTRKVRLRHDPELTARNQAAMGSVLPMGLLVRELGARRLASATRRMRGDHPRAGFRLGEALEMGRRAVRDLRRARRARGGGAPRARWWDPEALAGLRFAFPARVRVRMRDGTERVAEAEVPRGGAGHPEVGPVEVASEKLAVWGPRLWGEAATAEIDAAVGRDDPKLYDLLARAP